MRESCDFVTAVCGLYHSGIDPSSMMLLSASKTHFLPGDPNRVRLTQTRKPTDPILNTNQGSPELR